jgi:hypothetical protein
VAWLGIHLTFLTGFKNRFAALAEWTTAFLGRYRRQRTITAQQVFARESALTAQSEKDHTGDAHAEEGHDSAEAVDPGPHLPEENLHIDVHP